MRDHGVARWLGVCLLIAPLAACGDDDGGLGAVRVTVADQLLDPPDAVIVAEAALDRAGWVVIRADHIGIPAEILGFAPLERGLGIDVEVALARTASDGEVLWAELRYDEGTLGTFEAEVDPPARDGKGDVVARAFTATVLPGARLTEVVVDDQSLSWPFDVVVVRRATVQLDSAWVVVHEDAAGAPGAPIGRARLARGANTNLVMTLDRPALHEEVLWAQIAADAPPVGEYDASVDRPVRDADGEAVARSFVIGAARTTPALEVDDLVKSGDLQRVRVGRASSDGPGWVVVREAGGGGGAGPIVGQRRIGDGVSTNLDIGVGRQVRDGETFWAELYADQGVDGVFEPEGADPLRVGAVAFGITLDLEPAVEVEDEALSLSLRLRVDEARTSRGGWVVAQEDDGGAPGEVLGAVAIGGGVVGGTWLAVARPLEDGEVVWISAWEELGGAAEFDPEVDGIYEDGDGAAALWAVTVAVAAGTPAARLVADVVSGAWAWSTVPAWVGDEDVVGGEITLREGWRYEVRNEAFDAHPLALVLADADDVALDVVQLSQSGEGPLEEDEGVAWVEDDDEATFTVTAALMAAVDAYRCEAHPATLRGAVSYRALPEEPAPEP